MIALSHPLAAVAQTDRGLYQLDSDMLLRSELPSSFALDDKARGIDHTGYRIVGGFPVRPGQWQSVVAIYRRSFANGRSPLCGGSIVDREWVLTAGHCVAMRDASGIAVPRAADDLFIREGTTNLDVGGNHLNVSQVVLHPEYSKAPKVNDIALIRLAAPARSTRQQLAPRARMSDLLADGSMVVIVGFGLVSPKPVNPPPDFRPGPASNLLLQAEVPIVSKPKCMTVYPTVGTGATFCAGFDEGGKDTCQGDSGGPVFARDPLGQAHQIGIVSYGAGCAQPRAWGVYVAVGHFEDWIRGHVPNAIFGAGAQRPPTIGHAEQALQVIAGDQTSIPVSRQGQITVDITQGVRLAIGQVFTVRVSSSVNGKLIVFNRDEAGKTHLLFPNRFSRSPRSIKAGSIVQIPGLGDGFSLRTTPPAGQNEIIAMVLPEAIRTEDLTAPFEGLNEVVDPARLLGSLAERTRGVEVVGKEGLSRAIGRRVFWITPQ